MKSTRKISIRLRKNGSKLHVFLQILKNRSFEHILTMSPCEKFSRTPVLHHRRKSDCPICHERLNLGDLNKLRTQIYKEIRKQRSMMIGPERTVVVEVDFVPNLHRLVRYA